jgi:hypothetical protein
MKILIIEKEIAKNNVVSQMMRLALMAIALDEYAQ